MEAAVSLEGLRIVIGWTAVLVVLLYLPLQSRVRRTGAYACGLDTKEVEDVDPESMYDPLVHYVMGDIIEEKHDGSVHEYYYWLLAGLLLVLLAMIGGVFL